VIRVWSFKRLEGEERKEGGRREETRTGEEEEDEESEEGRGPVQEDGRWLRAAAAARLT
jgi:hypothetical protein